MRKQKERLPDTEDVKKLIKGLQRQRAEYLSLINSLKEKHREADKLLKELRKASSTIQKKVTSKLDS